MTTALLAIDVQKVYTDRKSSMYCKDADRTVERINKLVDHFRSAGRPIILVRHMYKRDGSDLGRMYDYLGEQPEDFSFKEGAAETELDERFHLPDGAHEIIKNRFSAFAGTNLDAVLRQLGVDRIVVCGFMTNYCCESTSREAHDRDYFVDFVIDATGTPGTKKLDQKELRHAVGETLRGGFARVLKTESALKQAYD